MRSLFAAALVASAIIGTAEVRAGSAIGIVSVVAQSSLTEVGPRGPWVTGLTHTAEAGSNRALIFIVHREYGSSEDPIVTSVTYGEQTMTKVIEDSLLPGSYGNYTAAFILDEAGIAAASSSSFVVTAGTVSSEGFTSAFFENVDQTTPIGASDSNTIESTDTITTSPLSTGDGDMVILGVTCGNVGSYDASANGFAEGTDQQFGSTSGGTGVACYKSATGADETPSATYSSGANRQAIVGFVVQAIPSITRTLTVSSSAGGTVTDPGIGDFNYPDGIDANIIAISDAHYHFVNWTGTAVDNGKAADPNSAITTVLMDDDYTVQANFSIDTRTITASAGANGFVEPNGITIVDYDSNLMFNATPDVGYDVNTWYLDGNTVQTGGLTYTLTNITDEHTVNVTFEMLRLTISGTITCGNLEVNDVNLIGLGVFTDSNGFYSASVDYGWGGAVIPIKYGYTFDPNSRSYTSVTSDLTAEDYNALPADDFNDNRRSSTWRRSR
jgi:hypothetical protein